MLHQVVSWANVVNQFINLNCGFSLYSSTFTHSSRSCSKPTLNYSQDPTNPNILESIQDPDNGSTSDTLSPASDGGPWKSNSAAGDDESSEVNQAWTTHTEEGTEGAEMDSSADNDNEGVEESSTMMG